MVRLLCFALGIVFGVFGTLLVILVVDDVRERKRRPDDSERRWR